MVSVMVLKQCGETGLRLPGQIYSEYEPKAEKLIASGLVKKLFPVESVTVEKPKRKKKE